MSTKTLKATLTLECKLTAGELKDFSKQLAEAIAKKSRIESEMDTYKAQKKGEIQQMDGIILVMSEKVNSEKEWRPVECEVLYDFGTGIKSYVRKDTGEECKTEVIPESERQEVLDIPAGKK